MNEDLSKNTLLVLVVLTIVISLLGTWTVIVEAEKISTAENQVDVDVPTASTSGKVGISVAEQPQKTLASGQVILSILPPTDN